MSKSCSFGPVSLSAPWIFSDLICLFSGSQRMGLPVSCAMARRKSWMATGWTTLIVPVSPSSAQARPVRPERSPGVRTTHAASASVGRRRSAAPAQPKGRRDGRVQRGGWALRPGPPLAVERSLTVQSSGSATDRARLVPTALPPGRRLPPRILAVPWGMVKRRSGNGDKAMTGAELPVTLVRRRPRERLPRVGSPSRESAR